MYTFTNIILLHFSIGYPVVTLCFGFKSFLSLKLRQVSTVIVLSDVCTNQRQCLKGAYWNTASKLITVNTDNLKKIRLFVLV